jgi:hypothetical protein
MNSFVLVFFFTRVTAEVLNWVYSTRPTHEMQDRKSHIICLPERHDDCAYVIRYGPDERRKGRIVTLPY